MRIIELKETVTASNDRDAEILRGELKGKGTLLINLMASPGAGKTTLLERTIRDMKDRYAIAVMEADVDSDVDAVRIEKLGAKAVQAHTGGMCHMDAGMTRRALDELGEDHFDLVVLENVGNLICPAEFVHQVVHGLKAFRHVKLLRLSDVARLRALRQLIGGKGTLLRQRGRNEHQKTEKQSQKAFWHSQSLLLENGLILL